MLQTLTFCYFVFEHFRNGTWVEWKGARRFVVWLTGSLCLTGMQEKTQLWTTILCKWLDSWLKHEFSWDFILFTTLIIIMMKKMVSKETHCSMLPMVCVSLLRIAGFFLRPRRWLAQTERTVSEICVTVWVYVAQWNIDEAKIKAMLNIVHPPDLFATPLVKM